MTFWTLMFDWPIPLSSHILIASGVLHRLSPCFYSMPRSPQSITPSPTSSLPLRKKNKIGHTDLCYKYQFPTIFGGAVFSDLRIPSWLALMRSTLCTVSTLESFGEALRLFSF